MSGLEKLPLREKGCFNSIVETPRHSSVKFSYENASHRFFAKKRLAVGYSFPFPFGFFPSTKGGDGDLVDVPLITDLDCRRAPSFASTCSALSSDSRGGKGSPQRPHARSAGAEHQDRPPRAMSDLPADERAELTKFFIAYRKAEGVEVDALGQGTR